MGDNIHCKWEWTQTHLFWNVIYYFSVKLEIHIYMWYTKEIFGYIPQETLSQMPM